MGVGDIQLPKWKAMMIAGGFVTSLLLFLIILVVIVHEPTKSRLSNRLHTEEWEASPTLFSAPDNFQAVFSGAETQNKHLLGEISELIGVESTECDVCQSMLLSVIEHYEYRDIGSIPPSVSNERTPMLKKISGYVQKFKRRAVPHDIGSISKAFGSVCSQYCKKNTVSEFLPWLGMGYRLTPNARARSFFHRSEEFQPVYYTHIACVTESQMNAGRCSIPLKAAEMGYAAANVTYMTTQGLLISGIQGQSALVIYIPSGSSAVAQVDKFMAGLARRKMEINAVLVGLSDEYVDVSDDVAMDLHEMAVPPNVSGFGVLDLSALPKTAIGLGDLYAFIRMAADIISLVGKYPVARPESVFAAPAGSNEAVSIWRESVDIFSGPLDMFDFLQAAGIVEEPLFYQRTMSMNVGVRAEIPTLETIGIDMTKVPPASFSWRDDKCMPAVWSQGRCGSCWAISYADMASVLACKELGQPIGLSPQHLVSCSKFDHGCKGALMASPARFMHSPGVTLTSCMPYSNANSPMANTCPATCENGASPMCYVRATTSVPFHICANQMGGLRTDPGPCNPKHTADMMKRVISQRGPVIAGMRVTRDMPQWMYASAGKCDSVYTPQQQGYIYLHAITIVGYSTSVDGQVVWEVRNSWGTQLGCNGYFKVTGLTDTLRLEQDVYTFMLDDIPPQCMGGF